MDLLLLIKNDHILSFVRTEPERERRNVAETKQIIVIEVERKTLSKQGRQVANPTDLRVARGGLATRYNGQRWDLLGNMRTQGSHYQQKPFGR